MGIEVSTAIWKRAPYKGGKLLVLLAMADFADNDGGSIFPTVSTLAEKARLEVRQVKTSLKQLRSDGVLELVQEATGKPGRANEYRIVLERLPSSETGAIDDTEGCNPQHGRVQSLTRRVQSVAPHIEEPSYQQSSQPSWNQEDAREARPASKPTAPSNERLELPLNTPSPSSAALVSTTPRKAQRKTGKSDRAELDAAYDSYNSAAQVHGWGTCQMRTPARDAQLRKRLFEAGGIDGWRAALEKGASSDFLCGRTPPSGGRSPFKLDIDFLLRQSSFVRLMEGRYDNRESSGAADGGGSLAAAARVAAKRFDRDQSR